LKLLTEAGVIARYITKILNKKVVWVLL